MHTATPNAAYLLAGAIVLRAAWSLFTQALRSPGGRLVIRRGWRTQR